MRRRLLLTLHGATRYRERCATDCAPAASLARLFADFDRAKCIPKRDRVMLLGAWTHPAPGFQRAASVTYLLNSDSGSVFVCEALAHNEFRLLTCYQLGQQNLRCHSQSAFRPYRRDQRRRNKRASSDRSDRTGHARLSREPEPLDPQQPGMNSQKPESDAA